jgi:glyoxylase-like metal-dependent hydrolase (beta-lactamase superfamily II)
MTGHVTSPAAALADRLPPWATLIRAPNPGPLTLDGTNTWVLRGPGADTALVVDPGPLDEDHLQRVAGLGPFAQILLTHGHRDHVEGAERLTELVGGVPIAAADHALCRDALPLEAGELGGQARDADLTVTVVPTPGHTVDSVCLLVEGGLERAVLTGDTILGRGTTVIATPDGDLGDYLDSLEVLREFPGVPALPGHGPALADCGVAATFYLDHRQARLDQVRQAIANGAKTADDIVAVVYADVDRSLWPAAVWSVQAQLAYLEAENGESPSVPSGLDPP